MKKSSKKKIPIISNWMRRLSRYVKVFVSSVLLCTIYLYLPASVRERVTEFNPQVDSFLASAGFKTSMVTDSLPIWGSEARVPCDDKQWADLCKSLPKANGVRVLESTGFTVGYSETMRNPLWVQYKLFDVKTYERGDRPGRFDTDDRTSSRVSHDDYTGSGYDRGHMAPNFGIATRYGREGQLATFSMSNIIPQTPTVNRNVWKEIEMLNAKQYGRFLDEILVITGPIFGKDPLKLKNDVLVPNAYYKIILSRANDELRALAFVLPFDAPATCRLNTLLVSIDEIEALTGINMLSSLPMNDEIILETKPATHIWFTIPDLVRYYLPEESVTAQ